MNCRKRASVCSARPLLGAGIATTTRRRSPVCSDDPVTDVFLPPADTAGAAGSGTGMVVDPESRPLDGAPRDAAGGISVGIGSPTSLLDSIAANARLVRAWRSMAGVGRSGTS